MRTVTKRTRRCTKSSLSILGTVPQTEHSSTEHHRSLTDLAAAVVERRGVVVGGVGAESGGVGAHQLVLSVLHKSRRLVLRQIHRLVLRQRRHLLAVVYARKRRFIQVIAISVSQRRTTLLVFRPKTVESKRPHGSQLTIVNGEVESFELDALTDGHTVGQFVRQLQRVSLLFLHVLLHLHTQKSPVR